jgi:hypothetical protein
VSERERDVTVQEEETLMCKNKIIIIMPREAWMDTVNADKI